MAEKRLKEQIKEVKADLKKQRKLFASTALSDHKTDLKLLDNIRDNIILLERKLVELERKYRKQ